MAPTPVENQGEDEDFCQALGKRLRLARDRVGMKQEVAAMALRVAIATFSRWEKGHHAPAAFHLKRLAELLGVSMDWLCGITAHEALLTPGTAIVDQDALDALTKAASEGAKVESLNGLVKPPSISVASLVPTNMRLVPPSSVASLHQSIERLVRRLT